MAPKLNGKTVIGTVLVSVQPKLSVTVKDIDPDKGPGKVKFVFVEEELVVGVPFTHVQE